jgi:septal ring factor EnvC (AmiA/AmiB activator)
MKEQLEQRLKELNAEFESGQKMLAELEAKQANMRTTLLRISGAIQVLQEELAKERNIPGNGGDLSGSRPEQDSQPERVYAAAP